MTQYSAAHGKAHYAGSTDDIEQQPQVTAALPLSQRSCASSCGGRPAFTEHAAQRAAHGCRRRKRPLGYAPLFHGTGLELVYAHRHEAGEGRYGAPYYDYSAKGYLQLALPILKELYSCRLVRNTMRGGCLPHAVFVGIRYGVHYALVRIRHELCKVTYYILHFLPLGMPCHGAVGACGLAVPAALPRKGQTFPAGISSGRITDTCCLSRYVTGPKVLRRLSSEQAHKKGFYYVVPVVAQGHEVAAVGVGVVVQRAAAELGAQGAWVGLLGGY